MHEVLFRGKAKAIAGCPYNNGKPDGEWVFGYVFSDLGAMKIRQYETDRPECNDYEVDPETVGQYTGLTDKNGVRIFEGDIVRYDVNYHDMVISYDVENWGGWLYEDMDDNMQAYSIYEFNLKDIAVVGNIHDNPELLREASKPIAQDVLASATDEGEDYIMGFTLMQG